MSPFEPTIAIVIPAYNAAAHLPRVLPAARRAAGEAEIVVVDAGSKDGTAEAAAAHGARVVRLPRRAGPAEARNAGVAAVASDVVLFIDADCVPHPDVVKRVADAFAADPDLVSLTGSYDSDPPDPGFFSQYMNLRHHYTHQRASREDASFWAGCGAVRRRAFLAAGGFDAVRFATPQIEDIELGLRLKPLGRTRLDPALHVTHLKRWTLRSVVETDIRQRAIPWSRLLIERGELPNDLNLRRSQRVAAALSPAALLALPGLPAALLAGAPFAAALAAAALAASVGLHLRMIRSFAARRSAGFAAAAWAFHQVHLCYSAATYVLCRLERRAHAGAEKA